MPNPSHWDKLRPIIKGVIEEHLASLGNGSSLASLCEEQGWHYNQTWRHFYHADLPTPASERILSLINFALSKGNPEAQGEILRQLTADKT